MAATESVIRRLAESVWSASRKETRIARTVVLKLKTTEFRIMTRSLKPTVPPGSCEELISIALLLRQRIDTGPSQRFRLVGVGLGNFEELEESGVQSSLSLLLRTSQCEFPGGAAVDLILGDLSLTEVMADHFRIARYSHEFFIVANSGSLD